MHTNDVVFRNFNAISAILVCVGVYGSAATTFVYATGLTPSPSSWGSFGVDGGAKITGLLLLQGGCSRNSIASPIGSINCNAATLTNASFNGPLTGDVTEHYHDKPHCIFH